MDRGTSLVEPPRFGRPKVPAHPSFGMRDWPGFWRGYFFLGAAERWDRMGLAVDDCPGRNTIELGSTLLLLACSSVAHPSECAVRHHHRRFVDAQQSYGGDSEPGPAIDRFDGRTEGA